ncbi:MAG: hypothetical protein ABSC19_16870 [Syntrophorhabdales bacterium]
MEVLNNWSINKEPAFLVIDALDAARGDPAQEMIQGLIRQVLAKGGRWRVIASIRKFDLRYGAEVKELFEGTPVGEFNDPEFARVRHLNVLRLSDSELSQIRHQSGELFELIEKAPLQLRELLRVPFNLSLMAGLLGDGVHPDDITPIKTQVELLGRYWVHRILRNDGKADAREALLREVCEKMVEDRRLLADRKEVVRPETSQQLQDLLRAQVLLEWQPSPEIPPDRHVLAFSHNVLFDYAVETLLFRGNPDKLVRRLASDPNAMIMTRPSLLFHFYYLWNNDLRRHQFWDFTFRLIKDSGIPEIGRLVGPAVAAELVATVTDLEPLFSALDDAATKGRTAGEQGIRHLVGALLAGSNAKGQLLGPGAGPWCELLERTSRNLQLSTAYTVRSLLGKICEQPDLFTTEQRADAGKCSRRLLDFAWSQPRRDRFLVINSLEGVCRTFVSDPAASAGLIRRSIEQGHLSEFGYEEMPWLARQVSWLIDLDEKLVGDIYGAVFAHEETSKETTSIGQSSILPLTSNRGQDYSMALYELARAFPTFLEHSPENATKALIAVTEAYVAQRHRTTGADDREEPFDFRGRQARILKDYSSIWDEGKTYRHDPPLKMIDEFQQYAEGLAGRPETVTKAVNTIQTLISENRLAVLWRRILGLGTRYPEIVGMHILPLAWTIPILTCYDTSIPAGDFIGAIYSKAGKDERERIERAILSIPGLFPAERRQAAEHVLRDRLIGCLSGNDLVTEEGRLILEHLRAENAIPPNDSPVQSRWSSRRYTEEDDLADQEVPIEAEANRKIRELGSPVKEFAEKHLNSLPTLDEAENVFPALRALRDALARSEVDGVHEKQRGYVWAHLVEACARIAGIELLTLESPLGLFVNGVLLEASRSAEPAPDPDHDAQFDDYPSWGGPAPRIDAAGGIISLAGHESFFLLPDVLEAMQNLLTDPVPAVRYQVAGRLTSLYRTSPELMWSLIELVCRKEPSRGVLQGLLSRPLQQLAGFNPDKTAELVRTIFDRVEEGPGAKAVRELCTSIFTGLCVWRDHPGCCKISTEIAGNPVRFMNEASHLLAQLQEALTHGPIRSASPEDDSIRRRAFDLLDRALSSALDSLHQIELRHWQAEDREVTSSLAQLIDHVASEIHTLSETQGGRGLSGLTGDMGVQERAERFYREAFPVLDKLVDVGLPSVAHHLLETLAFFIPIDPKGVFVSIGRVVRAGQRGGYQYESLASDLIVKLVERYIAEYRTLLRQDEDCARILVEILDVFVQAGWPSARTLTYGLEEIFR